MIEWSLDAFGACESVASIVVAAPPGHEHGLAAPGATAATRVVDGGATRAQSVANALAAVATDLVAIHDAARPLLTPALVEGLVARLDADPGAAGVIAAAPVTDTIKEGVDAIERTLDRSRLWAAQTPQVFRTDALRAALQADQSSRDAATDEAMLVEATGARVLIHPTANENFKVTTPLDLRVAQQLLEDRSR